MMVSDPLTFLSRITRRVWTRRGRRIFTAVALTPGLLFVLAVAITPLPTQLREDHRLDSSIRVFDRNDKVLAEVRATDGARMRWMTLEELGPMMPNVMMAAEDKRFPWHPGFDPIAIVRAIGQNLSAGHIVSGASTLTQQLGRTLVPRPRTIPGKIREMTVAARIEVSLSKRQIMESYLNLVMFGPNLRGVEAASRFYFDKPTRALSLAEVATVAAMPKGPTTYDPRRHPRRLKRRRDSILERVGKLGYTSAEQVQRAKRQPLTVHLGATGWGAPHFVRDLLQGKVDPKLGVLQGKVAELHTTLDGQLQREAQTATREVVRRLRDKHVTAASVVVLDNETRDVLAWVGSPGFFDEKSAGQNDGVIALRQPGSSLKPFVYGLAMDQLGWTAATALPDVELHFPGPHGTYSPTNYDGRFHGPVRLREALANSLNVPAVFAASVLGPSRVVGRLRKVGLTTIDKSAVEYGAAIALGDGSVRLIDLANAYATLAQGGMLRAIHPLRWARAVRGKTLRVPPPVETRVMPETVTRILTDILSDPNARLASFGPNSSLAMSFPVAAKTGTSKGFRDNITVGYTPRVTVAVWVGNFDGSAMQGVSGVTGAGPLFREVMTAAHRLYDHLHETFPKPDARFSYASVCRLSGMVPTEACMHKKRELFIRGTEPQRRCTMHELVEIDRRNGLRAGPICPAARVKRKAFEVFGQRYRAWAMAAHRNLAPQRWSPDCPRARDDNSGTRQVKLRVRYPYDGAIFMLDGSMAQGSQGLVLRADAPSEVKRLTFYLDGRRVGTVTAPFEQEAKLSKGRHRLWVRAGERKSEVVEFAVR